MNLSLLSKHRDSIFGISIISIILFHYCESYMNAVANGMTVNNIGIFLYYHVIGSVGVEIFLLLSGMGLYFSYSKNHCLKAFYTKRYVRILVCYIPTGGLFWILTDFIFSQSGVINFWEDFALLSFWICGKITFWFIALILILYAVFPFIYYILYRCEIISTISFWGLMVLTVLITVLLSIAFPNWYSGTEIALTRIPIFYLGCYIGKSVAQGREIRKRNVGVIIILGTIARCITKIANFPIIFSRYAASLWALALLLILCLCMDKLSGTFIERGFKIVGKYSLELYLSHVVVRSIMNTAGFPTFYLVNYLIVVLISVVMSFGMHKMSEQISKRIFETEK